MWAEEKDRRDVNGNMEMGSKKRKSQSTVSKWRSSATLGRGEERRERPSNLSDSGSSAACLHALACGLQMSLIAADSSCEFLMPGSHTFFPGRSQAASACICDSSPNPTPFPRPCHIQRPNWTRAYVSGEPFSHALSLITLLPPLTRFHHRFGQKRLAPRQCVIQR